MVMLLTIVAALPVIVVSEDGKNTLNQVNVTSQVRRISPVNVTSLNLTIPCDSWLLLVFHGSTDITVSLSLARPGANYSIVVSGGGVNFTASTFGPYIFRVHVVYPTLSWYNVTIRVYDPHGVVGYTTTVKYYTCNLTIEANINVISLPEYPTPEEIVRANYNATLSFIRRIINTIIQESLETRSELKRLEKVTDKLSLKLQGSLRELSNALREFRSNVDRVNELSFIVIAVYTITSIFAIAVLMLCARYLILGYG